MHAHMPPFCDQVSDHLPHWHKDYGKKQPKAPTRIATQQEMEQVQYLRDFGPNGVPESVQSRHPMMAEVDRLAELEL